MPNAIDVTGLRFGRLLVSGPSVADSRPRRVPVKCDCGEALVVTVASLRSGDTRSCGCLKRDSFAARFTTHGMTGTPEHEVWRSMLKRCTHPRNKEWKNYGGRGVRICDRWLGRDGFAHFIADMGARPVGTSIDRIDVNGNYEPANCRWATTKEQARNTRATKLTPEKVERVRTGDLAKMTAKRAAEALGVSRSLVGAIRQGKAWAA